MVLAFHPATQLAFSQAIKLVPTPPELNLRVLAAWRNDFPSLATRASCANRDKCVLGFREREGVSFLFLGRAPRNNLSDTRTQEFDILRLVQSMT